MNITKKEAAARIEQLKKEIEHHDYLYYRQNTLEISDYEYDQLINELKQLERKYPDLITPDSPTQQVGSSRFRSSIYGFLPIAVNHLIPMQSIDSIYNDNQLYSFENRIRNILGLTVDIDYLVEPKFDGVSASLTYEDGKLIHGGTRGDGKVGEDITMNLWTINRIPKMLSNNNRIPRLIEIRGEVLYPIKAFNKLNKELAEAGEPLFANPRNAASGSLRQLDPNITRSRPLDFYVWGLGYVNGYEFNTEQEIMQELKSWGFKVDENIKLLRNIDDVIIYQREIEWKRDYLPYEADGIVIKVNRRDYQKELGTTTKYPKWSIAYKFKPRQATTRVKDIVVQVGRVGLLTPVAELEPVGIGGITIKRASLHTDDIIRAKDIRIGDTVLVERAGDVIPEVVMPIVEKRTGNEKEFRMPEKCPSCWTHVEKEGAYFYCPNIYCRAQLEGRIIHLASRNAFNIKGLGKKLVQQLLERRIVKDPADVFLLKKENLIMLERFAEKSASKLLDQVETSKRVSFERFIYALSIRHVGYRVAQILADSYHHIRSLIDTTLQALIDIHTIGTEIAKSIVSYFELEQNKNLVQKLLNAGVEIQYTKKAAVSDKLKGQVFVFTGSLESMTRDEAERLVAEHGGRATSSVTKKTSYVVAGADPGSKYEKAVSLGIQILSEEEFRKMMGGL